MEKYILPGLIANAATLGIHWIYDHGYLETLASKQSILFLVQNQTHYQNAETAYYSYPSHELGDVTVQGDILKWLYQAMKNNKDFSQLDYSKLLYQQFKPGGTYQGYVESYAKKHVLEILAKSLEIDYPKQQVSDDHLVGFMPYLVCKELGLDSKKAWELTQVYSQDETYYEYFKMFDLLFEQLPEKGLKEAIESVIQLGPKMAETELSKALEIKDPNMFIENYSGRACAIKFSIPLIIHILYHTNSYEEAVRYNALLGGAIADRNTMIGAIFAQVSTIPQSWKDKVINQIKL
ncbi:MAG: hypothetical protein ACNA7U_04920 [Candidatus Izemoplasmataceae bacterium]|uniref:hypothetical protein n=1 Tax=Liberiplasma polymorphum TaxID=3374570 RepID=UPI0037756072